MYAKARLSAGGAALVALVLTTGCSGGSSSGAAAPTTTTTSQPAAAAASMTAPCISADEASLGVHFPAAGETLEGIVVGSGDAGIVLAHEADGDLCQWKPYALALSKEGYQVLAYTSGKDTVAGVVAAAAELRAKGAKRVLLVGASKGGTAVLTAAPSIQPPVAAVVDLSGPKAIDDVDATTAIGKLSVPTLFMAGTLDKPFVDDTKALYAAATNAPRRKLALVPGGGHGIALVETNAKTIEAFLRRYAKGS